MLSPTRSCWIGFLLLFALLYNLSLSLAQRSKELELSPEKQKLIKQANELEAEAKTLFQARKNAEGMATLQQLLAIEKKIYGPLHARVVSRLKKIGYYYEQLLNWDAARNALAEIVSIHTQTKRKNHWITQDAKRDIKELEQRQKLTPRERKLVNQSNQLNHQVMQLHRAGRSRDAIALAIKMIQIRGSILGKNSSYYYLSLQSLARLYQHIGAYNKALPLLKETLALRKVVLGEKHPQYATNLKDLSFIYSCLGEYDKALPCAQRALAIRKVLLGEKHPDYAGSVNNLAVLFYRMGKYHEALPLYQLSATLLKEIFGEKHPDYATSLNNLAALYEAQGEYSKAFPFIRHALKLRKELLGEKHPDYALSLSVLANLYHAQGDYDSALPLYQQAPALRKEVLGEKHPQYAQSLNNLAALYRAQGQYGKALPLQERALALNKAVLGVKHPSYARSLNNLALLYNTQGDYAKALPLYQQALAIRKEILGEKHPDYAQSLNNLGELYVTQGEYAKALPHYQQALAIRKEIYGEKHPSTASTLSTLAQMYHEQREFEKALPLYQQALAIRKEIHGEKHPSYLLSLTNLAGIYRAQKEYDKAVPFLRQTIPLTKEMLGEKHPQYAASLYNLAMFYSELNAYSKALPLAREAVNLTKEVWGEKHPEYNKLLTGVGYLYYNQNQLLQAKEYFLQGAKALLQSRFSVARQGLERASLSDRNSRIPLLASVLVRNNKLEEAWHWLEQSLGRSTFDEVAARNHRTSQEQQQLDQLRGTIQETEQRLNQFASTPELSQDQQRLQQQFLHKQSQRYARLSELYDKLETKYGVIEGKSFSLKQIQSSLSDNDAFLTWIDTHDEHWAVLIRAQGKPIFKQMKGQKERLSLEESTIPSRLYPLLITQREDKAREREILIHRLRKQRVGPIAEHLKDIEHVIILPSPLMDKVPTELLLPEKRVSHAPSATMYAYLKQLDEPKSRGLLALGDPIFNPHEELNTIPMPKSGILITSVVSNSTAEKVGLRAEQVLLEYDGSILNSLHDLQKAIATTDKEEEVRIKVWDGGKTFEKVIPTGQLGIIVAKESPKLGLLNRRRQQWRLASRGEDWNALPGTRIEVANIANLVNVSQRHVLLDSSASEQRLHQLASVNKLKDFKYLHFATHGQVNSFLPMESALILSRDRLQINVAELKANEPHFDGRLTAKEVALHWQLDADLVTLSACNSGLGKHARGEGYMGFAQSFLIRGSRSVVLSLWSVDDTATALLMTRFYENLIKKEMSKLDALREAKKWLRTLPRSEVSKLAAKMSNGIARGPGRKKLPPLSKVPMSDKKEDAPYAHPYYWSAFILIGDPH